MKQIIAIVRPHLVDQLLENLRLAPLEALHLAEVKGFGRQKNHLEQYASTEYSHAFLPKVEIIVYVDDMRVEEVVKTIVDTTRTGRMGDGKVMVLNVPETVTI